MEKEYVAVIRCKDCKHCFNGQCQMLFEMPFYSCEYRSLVVDPKDYCSWGEEKENDDINNEM